MKRRLIYVLVLVFTLLAGPLRPAEAVSPKPGIATSDRQTKTPIEHLVVVMQENHTFDNYFGTYPGAEGLTPDIWMPVDPNNPGAGAIQPYHLGKRTITDLSHSTATFYDQYAEGDMNGFVYALNTRRQDGTLSMGYYD